MCIWLLWPVTAILSVMVNFMYQFCWAKGCPDSWSSIALGVSVVHKEGVFG